jgi:hypothetical protein
VTVPGTSAVPGTGPRSAESATTVVVALAAEHVQVTR